MRLLFGKSFLLVGRMAHIWGLFYCRGSFFKSLVFHDNTEETFKIMVIFGMFTNFYGKITKYIGANLR